MEPADRKAVETVFSRIPHDEWKTFLESPHGRRFATRLETVRESLRALGQLPQGAPPKPVAETVDLLGQRLLLDHSAGPWLRTAILRTMPPGRWRALPWALRAGLRARAAPVAEEAQARVAACHECVPGAPSPSLRLRNR